MSIRKTDARWKKQWGHDERRTLTGCCGYCFGGGNPVIGHFRRYRNPHGAKVEKKKKKREREQKNINATYSTYIYIHTYTYSKPACIYHMVAIIVLNGCIRTQLFQTCAEKMERKGGGEAFSVSSFFFWKFVRRGSFSLLNLSLSPLPLFFHSSIAAIDSRTWKIGDAFNCSEADLARFRIDRLRPPLSGIFIRLLLARRSSYVGADIEEIHFV